jgi:surface antigen
MKRRLLFLLFAIAAVSANSTALVAQPVAVSGIIAKQETDLLSHDDKLAAYDAEQAVLAQSWGTTGYDWNGPNGAYGTIISGTSIAQDDRKGQCRRFIHIIHHANDGGANPTFQGTICRAAPDDPWERK